jgi:hypothetical protein
MRTQQTTGAVSVATECGPADTFVAIIQANEKLADGMAPDRSRSGATDHRAKYLWLEAGQSWPFVRGTETVSNRALWGSLVVVAACVGWAVILMASGGMRPMEATAQMELLARKLERSPAIPPETASGLTRLIGQPGYDCRQAACSSELAARNEAARSRLHQLLASKGPANAHDLSANQRPRGSADNTQ